MSNPKARFPGLRRLLRVAMLRVLPQRLSASFENLLGEPRRRLSVNLYIYLNVCLDSL